MLASPRPYLVQRGYITAIPRLVTPLVLSIPIRNYQTGPYGVPSMGERTEDIYDVGDSHGFSVS